MIVSAGDSMDTDRELAQMEETLERVIRSDADLLRRASRYMISAGGKRLTRACGTASEDGVRLTSRVTAQITQADNTGRQWLQTSEVRAKRDE